MAGADSGASVDGRQGPAAGGQLRALAVANMRYWPTVAPVMWRELQRWRRAAGEIPDRELRELAVAKLAEEAFNAEVAATLATLAPRAQRERTVKAIVALEVLFDYLDGRTERLGCVGERGSHAGGSIGSGFDGRSRESDGDGEEQGGGAAEAADRDSAVLAEGQRAFAALREAVADGGPRVDRSRVRAGGRKSDPAGGGQDKDANARRAEDEQDTGDGVLASGDGEYLRTLSRFVEEQVGGLPSFGAVAAAAAAAAERCGQAQVRLHAASAVGDEQLEQWARGACAGSGLQWREYTAGSASSVLAMHALIATAARPGVSESEGRTIDAAYLAIGAVITTLDSLVDETQDAARGESGYIRLYGSREEISRRLLALVREALARTEAAPDGAHHAMTLAGVAAYYTTHTGADSRRVRPIARAVRGELSPTIWPAVVVLRSWRAAKAARTLLRARAPAGLNADRTTGEHPVGEGIE